MNSLTVLFIALLVSPSFSRSHVPSWLVTWPPAALTMQKDAFPSDDTAIGKKGARNDGVPSDISAKELKMIKDVQSKTRKSARVEEAAAEKNALKGGMEQYLYEPPQILI
jgi:hypothetical protein